MGTRQPTANDNAKMPVIIASIAILFLLISGLAWHFLGPEQGGASPRALTAEEQTQQQWVRQKAKESGGDFTRLNQEDQSKMQAILGPRAPFDLRQMAHSPQMSP